MKVAGLNIHPLKSGRAIPQTSVEIRLDGLVDDRRFMVVDMDGKFITQRDLQSLARVEATPIESGVTLSMDGQMIQAIFDEGSRTYAEVWGSEVNVAICDDAVSETLSAWFGRDVQLVHMDDVARRNVEWQGNSAPVGFADGFPVLVTTTASLDDLNRTLAAKGQEPVGMDRFRTNILIENDDPWQEDFWETIEIGGIAFDLVKPCARCIMTTQDQMTGERIGGNPIQGLAEKRMSADRSVAGVLFGWNAVPRSEGRIRLGDAMTVVVGRSERWPMKIRA